VIRALIFDFDGLMLDTEGPDYRAWQELYREHSCELPLSLWTTCIGRSGDFFDALGYLEEQIGRRLERDPLLSRRELRHRELVEAEELLPGVADYLAEARNRELKLAIASSGSRSWVTGHLSRLSLEEYWDCVRCWGDVERAKPEPDLYLAVLAALEVTPGEAIAFEDSPNGILAAKRAGLFCVAVPNPMTEGLDLSRADLRLASLAELPLAELIARVTDGRVSPVPASTGPS
jgi:HAD superfamily hydrolase (TIGR01509 family)